MNGFIVIDKDKGMSSHDVVSSLRKMLQIKKVGHTGTLDPFATGVLPVAIGEATKAISFLDESTKEYEALMQLGVSTDTQDLTGKVISVNDIEHLDEHSIRQAFEVVAKRDTQVPPMFSALKRDGKPLYKLARKGESVDLQPRPMKIELLSVNSISMPMVRFTVRCSRGTYVRTIAADIGIILGCGAHLTELRRTASGKFHLSRSVKLDELKTSLNSKRVSDFVMSTYSSLSHLKGAEVSEKGAFRIRNGVCPTFEDFEDTFPEGIRQGEKIRLQRRKTVVAVAESLVTGWTPETQNLRLLRVFN
jgi:tRNA pseudouridine55 synthase